LQALEAAKTAIGRFEAAGISWQRPADYYAEMVRLLCCWLLCRLIGKCRLPCRRRLWTLGSSLLPLQVQ